MNVSPGLCTEDKFKKKLDKFHMHVLPSILDIHGQDWVVNLEVLDWVRSTTVESLIIRAQMRWMGHDTRMDDFHMPC